MNLFRTIPGALAVSLALTLAACGQTPPTPSVSSKPFTTASTSNIVLGNNTKILSAEARSTMAEVSESTLIWTSPGKLAATANQPNSVDHGSQLQVGDIIVSEPMTMAPYGLLRKVTAVRSVEGKTTVQTEEASLEDAIQDGDIPETTLPFEVERIVPQTPGIQVDVGGGTTNGLRPNVALAGFRVRFGLDRFPIVDGAGSNPADRESVLLSGNFSLSAVIDLSGSFRFFVPRRLNVSVIAEASSSLRLEGRVRERFDRTIPIAGVVGRPVVVRVGPLPIVVQPAFAVALRVRGQVGGQTVNAQPIVFTLNVQSLSERYRAGVEFLGNFGPFREHTSTATGPGLSLTGQANGSVDFGPVAAVALFSQVPLPFGFSLPLSVTAGVSGTGFIEFQGTGSSAGSTTGTISSGLRSQVRVVGRVIGRNIGPFEATLAEIRREIARFDATPPPPLPAPTGFSGLPFAGSPSTTINLVWNATPGATSFILSRNGTVIANIAATGANQEFRDTGLAPQTTFTYQLRAANASGQSAPAQITVSTDPAPNPVPPTPAGFIATQVFMTSVDLAWQPSRGATSYIVERSAPGGLQPYTLVGSTSGTSIKASGLVRGGFYSFRLRAVNASGQSAPAFVDVDLSQNNDCGLLPPLSCR